MQSTRIYLKIEGWILVFEDNKLLRVIMCVVNEFKSFCIIINDCDKFSDSLLCWCPASGHKAIDTVYMLVEDLFVYYLFQD